MRSHSLRTTSSLAMKLRMATERSEKQMNLPASGSRRSEYFEDIVFSLMESADIIGSKTTGAAFTNSSRSWPMRPSSAPDSCGRVAPEGPRKSLSSEHKLSWPSPTISRLVAGGLSHGSTSLFTVSAVLLGPTRCIGLVPA